jgi:hypothetical protein
METEQVQLQIVQAQQVARIETLCLEMHTRLFGAGVGILDKHDERLDSLENSRAWTKGALTVMGGLLSFIGWPHVRELFK